MGFGLPNGLYNKESTLKNYNQGKEPNYGYPKQLEKDGISTWQ